MSNPLDSLGVSDDVWNAWSKDQRNAAIKASNDYVAANTDFSDFGVGKPKAGTWTANGQTFTVPETESKSGAQQVAESATSGALSNWIPDGVKNTVLNRGFWIRSGTVVAGFFIVWVGILVILWGNKTFRNTAIKGGTAAATGGSSLAVNAAGSIVEAVSE